MITKTLSVRELLDFHFMVEDISHKNIVDKLNEGAEGHRAYQSKLAKGYQSEVPIEATFTTSEASVHLGGRMDVFCTSFDVPVIEELKLASSTFIPQEPYAKHIYQLYLYAGMLFQNDGELQQIKLVLTYIDSKGKALQNFTEVISKEVALQHIFELLNPYIRFQLQEEVHHTQRNESIVETKFPFQSFRQGQREMAVQVYTAITQRKKLFASLPTGTGKTIATLFPAIKAMQDGHTNKIFYLTARTAARQTPMLTLQLLVQQGLHIRGLVITAKEKCCLHTVVDCNPETCPFAKGHFVREKDAIEDIRTYPLWSFERIQSIAQKYNICPFEFSLSLYYLADVIICDYNYVFDPFVALDRAQEDNENHTVLVDEAHHLLHRMRDNLSATLSTEFLNRLLVTLKTYIPRTVLCKATLRLVREIEDMAKDAELPITLDDVPEDIYELCEKIKLRATLFFGDTDPHKPSINDVVMELYKLSNKFLFAYEHKKQGYKIVLENHKENYSLSLYCIDPRFQILLSTHGLAGNVYFSATLNPLAHMKTLFGGGEDDAIFSLPSPFPKEHLLVLQKNVSTYYNDRLSTAEEIAKDILSVVSQKQGNFIVYLPSYEYLKLMQQHIEPHYQGTLLVQKNDLTDQEKERFLESFSHHNNLLALCVLGGSFSEGIDLPGNKLVGVFIVGVGLSVPDFKTDLIKHYFDEKYQLGYEFAYLYPAMQRVLQAAGRVIRSETDKGIVFLFDLRFTWAKYRALLPTHWQLVQKNLMTAVQNFNLSS